MAELTAGFETGVNGNSVLTSDTGDASAWDFVNVSGSTTIKYDTTHVNSGSLAAKLVCDGTNFGNVTWHPNLGTTDHYGRIYLWITALPSAAFPIIQTADSGGGRAARIDIQHSGVLTLIDAPASGQKSSTAIVSTGQWIRIEYHVIHSATVGQIEVKLFNTASSTTPDETITSPATWNTGTGASYHQFGNPTSPKAMTVWMDDIVAEATSYPGPVAGASVTGSSSLAVTFGASSSGRGPVAADVVDVITGLAADTDLLANERASDTSELVGIPALPGPAGRPKVQIGTTRSIVDGWGL